MMATTIAHVGVRLTERVMFVTKTSAPASGMRPWGEEMPFGVNAMSPTMTVCPFPGGSASGCSDAADPAGCIDAADGGVGANWRLGSA